MFLAIDWSGALFSLMSIVAQTVLDPVGCVLYLAVLLLEAGIFVSHWIWLFRTRKQRRLERKQLEKTDLEGAGGSVLPTGEKEPPSGGNRPDLLSTDDGWPGKEE